MAPKSKQRDPAEQVRLNRLRRIVEDANALNQSAAVPTQRELSLLRAAFDRAVDGVPVRSYPELAVQCDNLLWQLEQRAKGNPLATTGFEEMERRRRGDDGSETGSTTESEATPGKRGETIRKAKAFAQKLMENENWKFAGIPRQRRLQTLAVTFVCFFTAMPFWICISGLLLFFPPTCVPMTLYLLYSLFWPLRHPLPLRRWAQGLSMYAHVRDYFPLRLVIPKEIRRQFDPSRNYMFCYHPHGVHSFGAMINFGTDANGIRALLPGIKIHLQTLGANLHIPFWRELAVGIGAGDASASTIVRTLAAGPGESVMLVVGGAEESLLSSPQTNDLLLVKRKGFVKLALRQGVCLVPVFGFGETNVYQNLATNRPGLQRILLKIQKVLGFALPAIGGRGWFNYNWGPLPFRCPIVTVVGAPISLPKIAKPSQEEIEHWHGIYMEALMKLYRENKDVYDIYCSTQARVVR